MPLQQPWGRRACDRHRVLDQQHRTIHASERERRQRAPQTGRTMPSSGGATSPTAADPPVAVDNHAKDVSRTTYKPDDYLGNLRPRLSIVPPPKPATNPLQFVKARPCSLYRSAQEQLKRSEEVKQAKQVVREDAEDWQSNLDNWKSSRRKRVEHIIDRVVEAKKLEQEEHNRNRRRSKTFSEMLEERGTRRKPSLAFYAEEEDGTEFSDTTESGDNAHQASASSADESGVFHSSNENESTRKLDNDNVTYPKVKVNGNTHFRTSSEDSSNTSVTDFEQPANTTGSNTTEYTYEGAINDYKSRVITWENRNGNSNSNTNTNNNNRQNAAPKTTTDSAKENHQNNNDAPKFEVLKRSEVFERKEQAAATKTVPPELAQSQSIKERLSLLENRNRNEEFAPKEARPKSSGDMSSVRERLSDLERRASITSADLPLVQPGGGEREADREDSGIHTADVSCSVSQADDEHAVLDDSRDDSVSQAIDMALELFDRQHSIEEDINKSTTTGDEEQSIEENARDEPAPAAASNVPTTLLIETGDREQHQQQAHVNTPIVTGEVMKFPPPLYQNVQMFSDLPEGDVEIAVTDGCSLPLLAPVRNAEPPKEKPPPPPVEDSTDDETQDAHLDNGVDGVDDEPMKRANSTRRIRDELRTKRSSFLGIEGEESFLGAVPQQPPDMTAFLRRERQLEQLMYRQSLCYDSDGGPLAADQLSIKSESRDSGVELDRTQSDPSPWSPVDRASTVSPAPHHEPHAATDGDEVARREREIIELLERDEQRRQPRTQGYQRDDQSLSMKLRQLEQENLDLERDRAKGIEEERARNIEEHMREQQGLEATDKDLSFDEDQSEEVLRVERELLQLEQEELRRQRESLQQRREWAPPARSSAPVALRHYASAQDVSAPSKRRPPVPPAKPLKLMDPDSAMRSRHISSSESLDTLHLRQAQYAPHSQPNNVIGQQMSRNTLHALSCTPRSRHIDSWVMQKRRSEPPVMNYNQHWLIQEAEQRRIEQQRGLKPSNQAWLQQQQQTRPEKHLPNSVIQTLTQRVQNRSNINGDKIVKRRYETNNIRDLPPQSQIVTESQEKMLSVSGKKKCSHCGDELGRGAAMIIESLQLFYHIDCFKCCVCRVQLGDGLMGTDVRVRNHKLHCHNCYSSDDGIKFSCV